MQKGLVIVFTGEGKGKTSAALGIALRASGHAMKVTMVQFLKSPMQGGEATAIEKMRPAIQLHSLGKGFVVSCDKETGGLRDKYPFSEHQKAAAYALDQAREQMFSRTCDILILDEINNAISLGLIDIQAVLDLLKSKPPELHVVCTGRDAHSDLIALADMVTEMHPIKHPYTSGIQAQKGIDY